MIKKSSRELPLYLVIPLFLIVVVVPMIVHLKVVTLDNISINFWTGQNQNSDFFSYYKAIYTIVFAALSFLVFLYARYKNIIQTKQLVVYYIPIFIYAILIIVSTALSKYPITAKSGFIDRYEGVYVLLAYLVILFTTINLVNNEKAINFILTGLFISSLIVGTIGIFQFFGMDLFQSTAGKMLMLPEAYKNVDLKFNFGESNIYTTLYNTNYVGSYTAILFPLTLAAFFYVKKTYLKIGTGILTCLMFANWVGCRSRAGYMGGAVAVLLLLFLLRKSVLKNYKSALLLFLSFVLIFAGMDSFAGGALSNRILVTVANINNYSAGQEAAKVTKLTLNDITISGNKASIICDKNTLAMELNGNQVGFYDTNNKELDLVKDGSGNITFNNKGYDAYKIQYDPNNSIFQVYINSAQLNMFVNQDGFKILGERNLLVDKIDHPKVTGFNGREKFASNRGFIWSRSIPLLKNNIIFGGGPDTFVFQFPQHDYVGKLRSFNTVGVIVDKPHNMYLQAGINTGVLSLIAILFLFAVYIVSSVKLYAVKRMPDRINSIGIALFCAVAGYLTAGLANDSLVSVAPVFWAVLGLGISCNHLVAGSKNNPSAETSNNNLAKVPAIKSGKTAKAVKK